MHDVVWVGYAQVVEEEEEEEKEQEQFLLLKGFVKMLRQCGMLR